MTWFGRHWMSVAVFALCVGMAVVDWYRWHSWFQLVLLFGGFGLGHLVGKANAHQWKWDIPLVLAFGVALLVVWLVVVLVG